MTDMTPERLAEIRVDLSHPWKHGAFPLARDLLIEVDRMRRLHQGQSDHIVALRAEVDRLRNGIEALARDYRNHYEMHGAAGDEYVVEDGRCVDVGDLLALLNPTEGEAVSDCPNDEHRAEYTCHECVGSGIYEDFDGSALPCPGCGGRGHLHPVPCRYCGEPGGDCPGPCC